MSDKAQGLNTVDGFNFNTDILKQNDYTCIQNNDNSSPTYEFMNKKKSLFYLQFLFMMVFFRRNWGENDLLVFDDDQLQF